MPLPTPKNHENREKFVSRCIADLSKNDGDKWPNVKQRAAICYKQSGETKKEREKAEDKNQ